MRGVWRPSGELVQAGGFGAVLGMLAGGAEYLHLYLEQAFAGDLAKPYWDIVLPYALVGAIAGVLAGVAARALVGDGLPRTRYTARLLSLLTSSLAGTYLAVWATYRLGPPVVRPANLLAYVGCVAAAVALDWGLARVLRVALARLDRREQPWRFGRVALPALTISLAVVLLLPPVYMSRALVVAKPGRIDPGSAGRPNIVYILIDAMRADHLPMYGYSRMTAPNLAGLARRGMTFTGAYAQGASTRPSVATLFSSLYPVVHKVHHERDFLSDSVPVLAEVLSRAGYQTFAVSANANVSPTFGYSQGFDEFRVWKTESAFRLTMMGRVAEDALGPSRLGWLLREHRDIVPLADAITDIALEWVARSDPGPRFMYVHYIDPHDPYRPPPPYDRAFDYRRDPPTRAGGVSALDPVRAEDRDGVGRTLDQYDGEILYADHEVGRLLRGLEKAGVLDDALVIVSADHGEEFLDHGGEGHGRSAYEEVLRVPFLVYWRDRIPAGSTHDGMVGLIDVMPTLLAVLGVAPPAGIQGVSFDDVLRAPGHRKDERKLFAQVVANGFALEMVHDGRYKLIRHVSGAREGLEEVYDLERDPRERRNIAAQAPALAAALRGELDGFNRIATESASRVRSQQAQKLDRDTERALRSLGYIK